MNPAVPSGVDPTTHSRPPRSSCGFTLIEGLVALAVIVLLILFLLPATRSSRTVVRRVQCVNNLKRIGVALYNYEHEYGVLPPAYTMDARGRPLHSWRTLILPFLEEQALYDTINLSRPWDDPANATARATRLSVYLCPEIGRSGRAADNRTGYFAPVGAGRYLLPAGRCRRTAEITDGVSGTLAVVEAPGAVAAPWMAPLDATDALVLGLGRGKNPALPHGGGFNAVIADGNATFFGAGTKEDVRRAFLSIAGGEAIPDPRY